MADRSRGIRTPWEHRAGPGERRSEECTSAGEEDEAKPVHAAKLDGEGLRDWFQAEEEDGESEAEGGDGEVDPTTAYLLASSSYF